MFNLYLKFLYAINKHNVTNRMVASITAFDFVYNNCFHHEMDFLSFGTPVQYQRVGLTLLRRNYFFLILTHPVYKM